MQPSIPLPSDDQLPADIRETLANLPPVNVFRMMANARRASTVSCSSPARS